MCIVTTCPNCGTASNWPSAHACPTEPGYPGTEPGPGFNTRPTHHEEVSWKDTPLRERWLRFEPVEAQARCLVDFDRRNAAEMQRRAAL